MTEEHAIYAFVYYGRLMTEHEKLAKSHLIATAKTTLGRTDPAAQAEAKGSNMDHLRRFLSDDPNVLALARDGYQAFVLHTGQRILHEHADQIVFNLCPECGRIARTPKARQCRHCGFDWHDEREIQAQARS